MHNSPNLREPALLDRAQTVGLDRNELQTTRKRELDVVLTVSGAESHDDARFHWTEDMVWVRAPQTEIDPRAPVPLVSHGEKCIAHRQVAERPSAAGAHSPGVALSRSRAGTRDRGASPDRCSHATI